MTERDGISFDFRARNVLVTGASAGIGLAIAQGVSRRRRGGDRHWRRAG